jgi:hypothetical protein
MLVVTMDAGSLKNSGRDFGDKTDAGSHRMLAGFRCSPYPFGRILKTISETLSNQSRRSWF